MKRDLKIKYDDKVVKTLTREQLIDQHPHDPKAGEHWDKVHGNEVKPAKPPTEK